MPTKIKLKRIVQPHMECGPAALKIVMDYLGRDNYNLRKIINDTRSEQKYVDWEFKLGTAAVARGFNATIFTLSTHFFDPAWYKLSKPALIRRLKKRLAFVTRYNARDVRDGYIFWCYKQSTKAIIDFLTKGGNIVFKPITKELISSYISRGIPVICPVNGSIFYGKRRVYRKKYDDIRGVAFGHFVTVIGHKKDRFIVMDNERMSNKTKGIIEVDQDMLINSILLFTGDIVVVER